MWNIKSLRTTQNMTLKELSETSNVAYGYISDLENNKASNPSYETLKKLAQALGVTVQELLKEEDSNEQDRANGKTHIRA